MVEDKRFAAIQQLQGSPDTVIALNPWLVPGAPDPDATEEGALLEAPAPRLGADVFVGREDVLERLEAAFRRCVFSREGVAVVLHGREGIGRRSVVRTFRARLQASNARFRTVHAEPAAGEGASLLRLILLDWFEAELVGANPVQAIVSALRHLVPTHEVVEVSVAVADVLDLELRGDHAAVVAARRLLADPAARQPFLTDVLRRLLQREAERQPLLLSFARLERADAESLAILGAALAELRNAPLLIMSVQDEPTLRHQRSTASRPRPAITATLDEDLDQPAMFTRWAGGDVRVDLSASRPTPVTPRSSLADLSAWPEVTDGGPPVERTQIVLREPEPPSPQADLNPFGPLPIEAIALGPLTDLDMETLVRRVLEGVRGVPEELIGMLLTDLEGVPGRLDARLTALKAHNVLERGPGGVYTVHLDRLLDQSLPHNLDSLAQARLRALPEKHRTILQLAALIGPRFSGSIVLALIRLTATPGELPFAEDRTANRLRQVLLDLQGRDIVAYEQAASTPEEQVFSFVIERERHLLLDALPEDRRRTLHRFIAQLLEKSGAPLEDVARHWEAGNAARRAAIARLRAGNTHVQSFRPAQAIEALEAACAQLDIDEGPTLLEGLLGLGQSYLLVGDVYNAQLTFERLAQYAYAMDELEVGAQALRGLGAALRRAGDFARAELCLQTATGLLDRLPADADTQRLRADLLDEFVAHRWQHGDHIREALDFAEKSLKLRTELGDKAGMARTMLYIGKIQFSRRRLDNARSCFERAAEMSAAQGVKDVLADARNALGVVALTLDDLDAAQTMWSEVLDLSRQLGDRALRATVLSNLGEVASRKGDATIAKELLHRSVELARSIGDHRIVAESIRHLSQLALRDLDMDNASALADQSLIAARQSGTRLSIALALRNRAEVLSATLYQDHHRDPDDANTQAIALPLSLAERIEEAERCFQETLMLLQSMGDKVHLRDALTGYRTFLAERGRLDDAARIDRRLEQLGL